MILLAHVVLLALTLAGNTEAALDMFSLAVQQGFFCVSYFLRDPAIHSIRENARFNEIIIRSAQ